LIDWKGKDWTSDSKELAATGNSRFTAPASQCPIISPDWEKPEGLPIDIIIFRRTPFRCRAAGNRRHSIGTMRVFMGANRGFRTHRCHLDNVGIRYDPFAMLPLLRLQYGDYFQHWFDMVTN